MRSTSHATIIGYYVRDGHGRERLGKVKMIKRGARRNENDPTSLRRISA